MSARRLGDGYMDEAWPSVLAKAGAEDACKELLGRWCEAVPTPLVLWIGSSKLAAIFAACLVQAPHVSYDQDVRGGSSVGKSAAKTRQRS